MSASTHRFTVGVLACGLVASLAAHLVRPARRAEAGPAAASHVVCESMEPVAAALPAAESCPRAALPLPARVARPVALPERDPTGADAQADALCKEAKSTLRSEWQKDRDKVLGNLVRSLRDDAEEAKTVGERARDMQKVLGLGDWEGERLQAAYAAIRRTRAAQALAGLEADPQDLDALFDAAKGLFADEDALARTWRGDSGVKKWRAAELGSRTTVVAFLASISDRDWDDDLVW